MTLRFTAHRALGFPPYVIVTGHVPVPPSHLLEEEELDNLERPEGGQDYERYVGWVGSRTQHLHAYARYTYYSNSSHSSLLTKQQ